MWVLVSIIAASCLAAVIIYSQMTLRVEEEDRIVVRWRCIEINVPHQIYVAQSLNESANPLNMNLEISRNQWLDKYRLRGHCIFFNVVLYENAMKHANVSVYARVINPKELIYGESYVNLQLLPFSTYSLPFSYLISTGTEAGTWTAEFYLVDQSNKTIFFDTEIIEFEVVTGTDNVMRLVILRIPEEPLIGILITILSGSLSVIGGWFSRRVGARGLVEIVIAISVFIGIFALSLYLFSWHLLGS